MSTILYFTFLHVSLLVPSYGFLSRFTHLRKKDGVLLVTLSYVLSIVVFGGISSTSYLFGITNQVGRFALITFLGVGVFFFIRDKAYKALFKQWFGIGAVLLSSLFATIYISLPYNPSTLIVPDPQPLAGRNYDTLNVKSLNLSKTQANDNYVPYRQAQFIVNKSDVKNSSFIGEWGVHFFQRTPLMGTVTAGYFILLNDSIPVNYTWSGDGLDPGNTYLKFQILAHILNSLILLAALLLIGRILTKNTAKLTVLFLIPSQFFLYNNVFSWPKSFTSFFMLLSFYFLLSKGRKSIIAAALVAGLGYLVHDLAILYIGSGLIFLLLEKRYRDGLIYTIIPTLFALPWIIMSKLFIGKPSSFVLYPFSIKGIPQNEASEIMSEFFATSPLRIIQIRLDSLVYLLTPYQLIFTEGAQTFQRRLWAMGIFSIPGSLGLGLLIPVLIGVWKKIISYRLLVLIFGPIVWSVIVIGWPKGLGSLHFAQGSVVLLTALAVHTLSKYKDGLLLMPVFLIGILQLIFFMLYSFDFDVSPWLDNGNLTLRVIALASIPIICSFGITYLSRTPRRQK